IAEYTAEQAYSTARQEIQDKIRNLVEERLSQKMMEHAGEEGEESYRVSMSTIFILYDVLVTGIELPAAIVAAINRKTSNTTSRRNTSVASSAKNESRNARGSRQKAFATFNRPSAKASRSPTCVGAASRRRCSFRNPRMRKSSLSEAAKTAYRLSLAMWIPRRRPRGARRRTGPTRRTRKTPPLPVRRYHWRKRLLLHWQHRPKRYRLRVRVLRRALAPRSLTRFGRSVYLISKPILRRCYSQLSGRQSLAQGSPRSDPATVRLLACANRARLNRLLQPPQNRTADRRRAASSDSHCLTAATDLPYLPYLRSNAGAGRET